MCERQSVGIERRQMVVCRGFLVWFGVRASGNLLIGDNELSLESEREKKINNLHQYLMKEVGPRTAKLALLICLKYENSANGSLLISYL